MTTQQQPDSFRPTGDELGAAWASRLNQTIIENITLEKLTAQLTAQIEVQTQNEARLQVHIRELEAKIAELKYHMQHAMSEEAAIIAQAQSSASENEKAPSTEVNLVTEKGEYE